MDIIQLKKWIDNSDSFTETDVELLVDAVSDYPYCQALRLIYLKALKLNNSSLFNEELKKAALYISDRKILYHLLEADMPSVSSKKKDKMSALSSVQIKKEEASDDDRETDNDKTLDLIDSFLSTIPDDELSSNGLELASDYTGYLIEEEEIQSVPMDGQELIDEFIETHNSTDFIEEKKKSKVLIDNSNEHESQEESEDSELDEEGFFTETLAKIYVKQHRYIKALEILKKLSLKYPNKNAYFADQIRFLEKLIINDKSK